MIIMKRIWRNAGSYSPLLNIFDDVSLWPFLSHFCSDLCRHLSSLLTLDPSSCPPVPLSTLIPIYCKFLLMLVPSACVYNYILSVLTAQISRLHVNLKFWHACKVSIFKMIFLLIFKFTKHGQFWYFWMYRNYRVKTILHLYLQQQEINKF